MNTLCNLPTHDYWIGDNAIPHSQPAHWVTLDAFSLATSVVTNVEFAAFIDAGGYSNTLYWTQMGWRWQGFKQETKPAFWDDVRFNQPNQPVVGVSWYEAVAFARWLAVETQQVWRLPTEAEWEAVARVIAPSAGTEQPQTNPALINSVERGIGQPWDAYGVGNQSACGAWNLLGNVWELTSSRWGRNWQTLECTYPYDAHDGRENLSGSYARVMRGGSYFDALSEANPAHRGRFLPGARASNIGFRLALG